MSFSRFGLFSWAHKLKNVLLLLLKWVPTESTRFPYAINIILLNYIFSSIQFSINLYNFKSPTIYIFSRIVCSSCRQEKLMFDKNRSIILSPKKSSFSYYLSSPTWIWFHGDFISTTTVSPSLWDNLFYSSFSSLLIPTRSGFYFVKYQLIFKSRFLRTFNLKWWIPLQVEQTGPKLPLIW